MEHRDRRQNQFGRSLEEIKAEVEDVINPKEGTFETFDQNDDTTEKQSQHPHPLRATDAIDSDHSDFPAAKKQKLECSRYCPHCNIRK